MRGYILYLAFANDQYYPAPGMDDCVYSGPSEEAARAKLGQARGRDHRSLYGVTAEGHIYELEVE